MASIAITNRCIACTSTIPRSESILSASANSLEMFVDSWQRDVASDEHGAKPQRAALRGQDKFQLLSS